MDRWSTQLSIRVLPIFSGMVGGRENRAAGTSSNYPTREHGLIGLFDLLDWGKKSSRGLHVLSRLKSQGNEEEDMTDMGMSSFASPSGT